MLKVHEVIKSAESLEVLYDITHWNQIKEESINIMVGDIKIGEYHMTRNDVVSNILKTHMFWTQKDYVDLDARASPAERYTRNMLDVMNAKSLDFFPSRTTAACDCLRKWYYTPALALGSTIAVRITDKNHENASLIAYALRALFGAELNISKVWISRRVLTVGLLLVVGH